MKQQNRMTKCSRGFRKLSLLSATMLTLSGVASCVAINVDRDAETLDQYEEVNASTIIDAPEPDLTAVSDEIKHGRYMVELLGCGACHTDGALIGEPRADRLLAGSSIGIAYSNPLVERHPGVVFASNLTPDKETGIGSWNEDQLIAMIQTGTDRHGHQKLSVMPWPAYSKVSERDAKAIAAYLKALKPIEHKVPKNNSAGWETSERYVYFGIYQNFD